MSFLSDLFEGNFSNLGHDITSHFSQDLPYYVGAGALGVGGLGLAGIGPLAGLGGAGAADAGSALSLAAPEAAATAGADLPPEILTGASAAAASPGPYLAPVSTAGEAAGAAASPGFDWGSFFTKNAGGLAGAGVAGAGLLMNAFKPATVPGAAPLEATAAQSQGNFAGIVAQLQDQQSRLEALRAANVANIEPTRQTLLQQQQELLQPLLTGQLMPGQEASVQAAKNDAITTIKSRYAALGLGGSSAEAEAVAGVEQNIPAMRLQIAQQSAQDAMTLGNQAIQNLSQETGTTTTLTGQEAGLIGTGAQAGNQALSLQQQIYAALMNAQIQQDQQLQTSIANFARALGTSAGGGGAGIGTAGQKFTLTAA